MTVQGFASINVTKTAPEISADISGCGRVPVAMATCESWHTPEAPHPGGLRDTHAMSNQPNDQIHSGGRGSMPI